MINKDDLIRQVMDFQWKINRLILEHKVEQWLSLNLSIDQLKSLIFIHSEGKTNFRELANALNITPAVVTGIVDRLTALGMIKRLDSHGDRRVHWLSLSDKGNLLIDELRQKNVKAIQEILETMNDEDVSALVRGFSALLEAIELYLKSHHGHFAGSAKEKEFEWSGAKGNSSIG
jgi:DNA-binding MarR family transcriptional regulator